VITATEGLTSTEAITTTDGVTTTGKPTLSAELATGATREARSDYDIYVRQAILERTGISESEYREIVRNQLLRTKLQEELGTEVDESEPQVEVAYLAFSSNATAEEAAAALEGGEDWEAVVEAYRPPEVETTPVEDTGGITSNSGITTTGVISETELQADPEVPATATAVATPTTEAPAEIDVTEALTGTGAASTGSVTSTETLTEALAVPTPAPTATPDPYWSREGARSWMTRQGLKDDLGLSDAEATEFLDTESGAAPRVMDGREGWYLAYVFDKDDERALPEAELESKRSAALEDWLTSRRIEVSIDRFPLEAITPAEPEWFTTLYDSIVGTSLPAITDPIQVTTVVAPPSGATEAP
jgi:hypothetical protein